MRQTQRQFDALRSSVDRAKRGMNQMTMGAGALGGSLLAVTVPMAMGVRAATKFNEGMSGVQAITQASAEDLELMRQKAIDLSLQTVYTGTQVAGAMEILARAGFNTNEVLDATSGVLAAAAAEGLEMAEAADIITIALRGMGRPATDASVAADVLASVSAKSNTSIRMLGESFVYGAAQARVMGLSLEETAAAFGTMADFGIRASMAGTNFSQMLIHLAKKPTKEASAALRNMGLHERDLSIATYGFAEVIDRLRRGYTKLNQVERERISETLFGIRGMRAAEALISDQTGKYQMLVEATKQVGSAQEMAATRLRNVAGAMKMVGASVEAFWIVLEAKFEKPFAIAIGRMIDGINSIVFAMRAVQAGVEDPITNIKAQMESVGSIAVMMGAEKDSFLNPEFALSIAQGIFDGVKVVVDAFKSLLNGLRSIGEALGLTALADDSVRNFARITMAGLIFGAILGPVLLAVVGLKFAFGGLFGILGGGFNVIAGLGGMMSNLGQIALGLGGGLSGAAGAAAGLTGGVEGATGALAGYGPVAETAFGMSEALAGGLTQVGIAGDAAGVGGQTAAAGIRAAGVAAGAAQGPLHLATIAFGEEGVAAETASGWNYTVATSLRSAASAGTTAVGPVEATAGALIAATGAAEAATPAIAGAATAMRGLGAAGAAAAAGTQAAAAGLTSAGAAAATGAAGAAGAAGRAAAGAAAGAAAFGRFGAVGAWLLRIFAGLARAVAGFTVVGAILTAAFLILRKEGEGVGQTLARIGAAIMGGLKAAFAWIASFMAKVSAILRPAWEAFEKAIAPLAAFIRSMFQDVLKELGKVGTSLGENLVAGTASWVVVLTQGFQVLGAAIKIIVGVWRVLWPIFITGFRLVMWVVRQVIWGVTQINMLFNKMKLSVSKVGASIMDALMFPIRWVAEKMAALLESVSGFAKKLGVDLTGAIEGLRMVATTEFAPTAVPEFVGPPAPPDLAEFVGPPEPEPFVGPPEPEGEQGTEVTHTTNLNLDGKTVATVVEKYRVGIQDRAGAKTTPWQRRQLLVRATVPAKAWGGEV